MAGQQMHRAGGHLPGGQGVAHHGGVRVGQPGVQHRQFPQIGPGLGDHGVQAFALFRGIRKRVEAFQPPDHVAALPADHTQRQVQAVQGGAGHQAQHPPLGQPGQPRQALDAGRKGRSRRKGRVRHSGNRGGVMGQGRQGEGFYATGGVTRPPAAVPPKAVPPKAVPPAAGASAPCGASPDGHCARPWRWLFPFPRSPPAAGRG